MKEILNEQMLKLTCGDFGNKLCRKIRGSHCPCHCVAATNSNMLGERECGCIEET